MRDLGHEHDDYKIHLINQLVNEMNRQTTSKPPNLRSKDRKKVKEKTAMMDEVLQYFTITNLEELNKILCASANVVAEEVGYKTVEKRQTQEPWWKRLIDEKIKELRKDLSRILNMRQGKLRKGGQREKLERKYSVKEKVVDVVKEELKTKNYGKDCKAEKL